MSDLFIVDNSDKNWKVKNYLHEWADLAHTFDVATGYFEIGALLALDGQWQKLDKLRILMGDEVSKRTKDALLEGVKSALDESIERTKEKNDFLSGMPAIVEAMQNRRIECKVFAKKKFHAKTYITHGRQRVVGSTALVGSSNFTLPGLTDNVELNVQIRREVDLLQEWFERHWDEAEDITPEIFKVIERHIREYSPFEVYAKALQEYFRGRELTAGEWEQNESVMYRELDQYQREGYQALMKISRQHRGAFLCDGVGLGKTFVGMMLIEHLVDFKRRRVALFVPKAARKPVWEKELNRYLPHLTGVFSNLVIFNHTDLQRGGETRENLERVREMADTVIIDEAHHFRNPGVRGGGDRKPSRYHQLYDLVGEKDLFLLTATPINNRLMDLRHMIELFSRRQEDYFKAAPLSIQNLRAHFIGMEKQLDRAASIDNPEETETNQVEAERVLSSDNLFQRLVVQRSRAYVKQSQEQQGGQVAVFPEREKPKVAKYSIKKTYGSLLDTIEKAFNKEKPLFSLAIYYPLAYYKGPKEDIDSFSENRQKQVVGLIRTLFLKRFESSARAFELSCQTLLTKLLAFARKNSQTPSEKNRLERWMAQNADMIGYVQQTQLALYGEQGEEEQDEDVVTEEMLEDAEGLSRDEYEVGEILSETFLDLEQVADFLNELKKFKPSQDDKLNALKKLLKTDQVLKENKVLIFTEFMATAKYLRTELEKAGIEGLDEVDSSDDRDRGAVIRQFAPYYNRSSSAALQEEGLKESRVLISTDVLSEGLNLQDATRLINYDLHWNPVRLMQRIGRVDRRMNPEIEDKLLEDHPDQKELRGNVAYWNFLPPGEIDSLLKLYGKVSHKILRISAVFGIEGRKLLTPDDDFNALKNFNESYEGTTTTTEEMHLEFQRLLKEHPDLQQRLDKLPGRVFSGKEHPSSGSKAVFFCYALPAPGADAEDAQADADEWTEEAGRTGWYLYDLDTQAIADDPPEILELIRSAPETPRRRDLSEETLTEVRKKVEKHIKNTYLKNAQAPQGVTAKLKAWMEVS